ncbi:MAG TPA: DEAD/DEAH box helicase [Gemmatimonadota bacterium]|nr:DEAD/DEAH box helicase [Gemmatimonadota bacterium]
MNRTTKNGRRNGASPKKAPAAFTGFGLLPELEHAIADLGFEKPTPIQAAAIPPALEGRDVLACAMTGSGKTAAFVLPILQRLHGLPRGTTRALVLTPTRELAAQVAEHFAELAVHTKLKAAVVHGGVGAGPQEAAFKRGVDVIVATPGRLLDHFSYGYARLAGLEVLVLDEADRMLDMGFLPDIKRIIKHLPKGPRQTLFFSATIPDPIVELSKRMLKDPVRIAVERKPAPATGVAQAFYPVPSRLKTQLLAELLTRGEIGNAIVFTRTKHRANRLTAQLEREGFEVGRIHGNRSQSQRTAALAAFKNGRTRVLVATDIVARGIDVEALDPVVNYDVPNAPEDYIHRVGRTARAELTGDAYTLISPEEESQVRAIERAVGREIERRTVEGFDYTAAGPPRVAAPRSQGASGRGRRTGGGRTSVGGNGGGRTSAGGNGGGPKPEAEKAPSAPRRSRGRRGPRRG